MNTRATVTALLLIGLQPVFSQKNVKSFLVVSYYVENLFDTVNSPVADGDEFTPGARETERQRMYSAITLREEWMLYHSEAYGEALPSATYGGTEYYGGPGDHLPVYVEFKW
jgi:hypothetical protein